jgi:GNAT superfamily N-acetyltransferase
MPIFQIRPIRSDDYDWIVALLRENWASEKQVYLGKVVDASKMPGFVATREGKSVGLITYRIDNDKCEVVTMNSVVEGIGIGSALIEAVKEVAAAAECRRLWLITTNDNVEGLRFYQKRGFVIAAVHRDAFRR